MHEDRIIAEALITEKLRSKGHSPSQRKVILDSLSEEVIEQVNSDLHPMVLYDLIMNGYHDSKASHEEMDD